MAHDHIVAPTLQAQPMLAHTLRAHLIQFLRPVAERLAAHLDIRLVQTALDLVQIILCTSCGRPSVGSGKRRQPLSTRLEYTLPAL
jgi:hypothetical protein